MAPGRGPRAAAKRAAPAAAEAPAATEAPPATEAPRVCAAGLLASAEAVFDRRVSDHLPQSYGVALPSSSVAGPADSRLTLLASLLCPC